jgi:hypothetical protein
MKPEHKAVLKVGGSFGLLGASVLALVGTPVAWAALAYGTYRVSRAAYQEAKSRATIREDDSSWHV